MQVAFGIGILIFIWLYNLIRYRETPCTTKREFELAIPDTVVGGEDDRKVPETPKGAAGPRRSTIAITENFENSGLRLVSVVSNDFRSKTTDEMDTASSASTSSATGLSSLDPTDEEPDPPKKRKV